jgi:protease-4
MLTLLVSMSSPAQPFSRGGEAVAVIDVTGVITGGSSLYAERGVTYADTIKDYIGYAVDDPSVRAIVVHIDSPGGGVTASVDIYEALLESPKPVVASMGDMAASGGYYVACAADHIVTRRSTLTGSIGVIAQFISAEELLEKVGVRSQTVQTGPYKDQGSLYRPLTDDEIAIFQAIIDESYDDFVQVIVQARDLPEEEVRALADGRLYSGLQAIELGLADSEGDLDDAIALAALWGGIVGEPRIQRYEAPPRLVDLFFSYSTRLGRPSELALVQEMLGLGRAPRLMYIYAGP